MEAFPFSDIQDSAKYSETSENVAVRAGMEGGYVYTRPRFTRAARKTFTTGLTNLSNEQKQTLETFWNTVKGGSDIFTWVNPVTLATHNVRFTKPIQYEYAGRGGVHRWNVSSIELEEA